MLIAEEYLLLTMRDDGHGAVSGRDLGVSGALLCELAVQERVMLDDRGRLSVLDPGSTGDEVLDEALTRIGGWTGRRPKDVLRPIGKDLPRQLLQRLARAEVIQEQPAQVLGMRMWSAWPFVSTTERDALRAELLQVLTGQQAPDARTGSLVALLEATSAWGTALPKSVRGGLRGGELKASAKEIAQGRWGSEAVARAVAEMASAASAAVMVAATSGGDGGSSSS